MNVDFGLICMFVIQLAIVFGVYHAWRGIKAEISALEVHRQSNRDVTSGIDAIRAEVKALDKCLAEATAMLERRIADVEAAPRAGKARMEEFADQLVKVERRVEALDGKLVSLSGRLSAFARHRKVSDDEEEQETAPAPQGEGEQIPLGFMPPGAIPLSVQPQAQAPVVPPGFGVVRRSRHG